MKGIEYKIIALFPSFVIRRTLRGSGKLNYKKIKIIIIILFFHKQMFSSVYIIP